MAAARLRLFVAVPVELPRSLASLTRELADTRGLRAVTAGHHHLTLRFLGDTPASEVEGLAPALDLAVGAWHEASNAGPLALKLVGLGTFPLRGSPRVLWAGIQGAGRASLLGLAEEVEAAMEGAGYGRADRRFRPHLTLARVRKQGAAEVRPLLMAESRTGFGPAEVSQLVLYSSQLAPGGPIYTVQHTVLL